VRARPLARIPGEAIVFASLLLALDFPLELPAELARPALVGAGSALALLILFGLGGLLVRSRRRPAQQAPSEPARTQEYDPFSLGSATEQRSTWRRKGNPVNVLIRGPGCDQEPIRGWVFDRSTGGVGLAVDQRFAPGDRLKILVASSEVAPWVDVEVRSATARGKREWLIGCQFCTPLQWNVLLLFG
jgi:hypothetical protein